MVGCALPCLHPLVYRSARSFSCPTAHAPCHLASTVVECKPTRLLKALMGLSSLDKVFRGLLEIPGSPGVPPVQTSDLSLAVPVHRAAPSATQITEILPHSSGELLYLGTESGTVFVVQLPGFRTLDDRTISSEAVLQW